LDDTGAAMEADYEMGALTMQSLGLNLYDLEEPHVSMHLRILQSAWAAS